MELAAAFLLGVVSAPHCIAMCGGIATALLMGSRPAAAAGNTNVIASSRSSAMIGDALIFGSGKIAGYVVLGAIAGLTGYLLGELHAVLFVVLRALAGLLLIALGLYTAGWWLGLQRLEQASYRLWQPALGRLRQLDLGRTSNKLTAGLFWGLLPCGIVYSVLGMALASGSILTGALVMLAFGLGTLPFVLSAGGIMQLTSPILQRPSSRQAIGLLLIAFGLISLYMAIANGQHH